MALVRERSGKDFVVCWMKYVLRFKARALRLRTNPKVIVQNILQNFDELPLSYCNKW